MVSLQKTYKKYHGKYAAIYEKKRMPQMRWNEENEIVWGMLPTLKRGMVLDCPVGTGRFLKSYALNKLNCIGIDCSDEMLALAKKKKQPGILLQGNAVSLPLPDESVDHVVCIRFLDLIDEISMQKVTREFMRVARCTIICTIRFGTRYIPKVNTATHDVRRFNALIKKGGWEITERNKIFEQGWEVLKIERRNHV